jgi:hypothetical protein
METRMELERVEKETILRKVKEQKNHQEKV